MHRAEQLLLRANRAVFGRLFIRGDEPIPPQVCYDRAQRDARRGYCLAVAGVLLIVGGNERIAGFGRSEATADACQNWTSHDEIVGAADQLEAVKQELWHARVEADEARDLAEELEGRHLAELYNARSEVRGAVAATSQVEEDLAQARAEATAAGTICVNHEATATAKTALLAEQEASAARREAQLAQQADAARHALSLERASSAAASVAAFGEKAEAAQAQEALALALALALDHCPCPCPRAVPA